MFLSLSWGLVLAVMVTLFPTTVFAAAGAGAASGGDSSSLGQLICNVRNNSLKVYPYIINVVAYIVGSYMAVRSILLFKKHAENPGQSQVVPATAQMFGAGAFLSFPSFAKTLQQSLFKNVAEQGSACQAGKIGSGAVGLDQMMQNFVQNLHGPIFTLLSIICLAVGLTMIFQGLMKASKTGTDPRASSPKDIVVNFVIGAVLISIGTVLPTTLSTLFGSAQVSNMTNISIIKWSTLGDGINTEQANKTVRAVLAFVQIIGGISFVRGWMILKKAVEGGQATVPQALTHIIAGSMAINIDKMLKIMNSTFGTDVIA